MLVSKSSLDRCMSAIENRLPSFYQTINTWGHIEG